MKDKEEGGLREVGECEEYAQNEDGEDGKGNQTSAKQRVVGWVREKVLLYWLAIGSWGDMSSRDLRRFL